jgi:hypothetical protein
MAKGLKPDTVVAYGRLLNRDGQLYAVKDKAFWDMLEHLKLQCGGTWKDVVKDARISTRSLRKVRNKGYPTVSHAFMDKVLGRLGLPHMLEELEWHTPDELVAMGVWKPHNVSGLQPRKKANADD